MSYTNLQVSWQAKKPQNAFADIEHKEPIQIWARKEVHEEVVKTTEGKEEMSHHRFYVDPAVEPNALNIEDYDKLDGELIVSSYRMCTLKNKVRMIRFITV